MPTPEGRPFVQHLTHQRVHLTTSGTGRTITLRTARPHPLLVQHIKALPQRARRWDKHAGAWRVSVAWASHLTDVLAREGFDVQDER